MSLQNRVAEKLNIAKHKVYLKKDLAAWNRYFLPEYFKLPDSQMHRWICKQLDRMIYLRGTKINVLGPRGAAKSTIGSLAYPLRCAIEGRERLIWIISDTASQAQDHLANIRQELERNQSLAEVYPQAVGQGKTWRVDKLVLNNGGTIQCFGTGEKIRGRRHGAHRPSLIVCDDIQNDDVVRSTKIREKNLHWFSGSLLKAGNKQTNVVHLATALHREAIGYQLLKNAGWKSRVFKAIQKMPENIKLWQQWEDLYHDYKNPIHQENAFLFYCLNRKEMDQGSQVLWPEVEDLYTLMKMRADEGVSAFEREKQSSPFCPEACEWPATWFDQQIWFDQWPRADWVIATMSLDPSQGKSDQRGDYSAYVMLRVDRQGTLFVEADLQRRVVNQMVADGVQWIKQFQPDYFGIEANGYQDLLAGEFAEEMIRQQVFGVTPHLINNQVNKIVRIRRLGPYLAAGRIKFKTNSAGTTLLVQQLQDFPIADHDDGPDAVEMALRLAIEKLSPLQNDGLPPHGQVMFGME